MLVLVCVCVCVHVCIYVCMCVCVCVSLWFNDGHSGDNASRPGRLWATQALCQLGSLVKGSGLGDWVSQYHLVHGHYQLVKHSSVGTHTVALFIAVAYRRTYVKPLPDCIQDIHNPFSTFWHHDIMFQTEPVRSLCSWVGTFLPAIIMYISNDALGLCMIYFSYSF